MIKSRVIKAYMYAEEKHSGQKRKYSGLDYFIHPKSVGRMAEDLTRDEDLVIAGFLHDVVEDCGVKIEEIQELFGERVANLVYELTTQPYDRNTTTKKDVLLAKMVSMSEDGLTVKLLDRLDNISYVDRDCKTMEHKVFVKKYFDETTAIMKELKVLRTNKTKLHNAIIRMIEAKLDYIKLKHLW